MEAPEGSESLLVDCSAGYRFGGKGEGERGRLARETRACSGGFLV